MLHSEPFKARHRSNPKHFTRERALTFPLLCATLMRLPRSSIKHELEDLSETIAPVSDFERPTTSAFSQARSHLLPSAFVELADMAREHVYNDRDSGRLIFWNDLRLVAIDGSTIRLPESDSVRREFDVDDDKPTLARISQCHDVLNNIIVDAAIGPLSTGEREMAIDHLLRLASDDLLLVDRGYAAHWFFRLAELCGIELCARVPADHSLAVREFVASGRDMAMITLAPTNLSRERIGDLEAQTGVALDCVPVRLKAVRIELESGELEVLLTSLVQPDLTIDDFSHLYSLRWGVETIYRQEKLPAEMENFTGKTALAVRQEYFATVFACTLGAVLALPATEIVERETAHRALSYQINFKSVLCAFRRQLARWFWDIHPLRAMQKFLRLAADEPMPVRPGRSHPRKPKVKPPRHSFAYKGII